MKYKPIRNIIQLLAVVFIFGVFSCSEEIVPIEKIDRSALDSLETEISVISDDIFTAKTTANALKRKIDSLNAVLAAASQPSGLNPDVHLTLQVLDGSQGYGSPLSARKTGLPSAVVTVSQGNVTKEVTTDASGLASFPEMESGFISVTVEISGYSNVYMIVDLRDGGADSDANNAETRYASTQVLVFPTEGSNMFTLTGTSYYNQDLNNLRSGTANDPYHPLTGDDIYEKIPQGTSFLIDCIPTTIPNNASRAGRIIDIVYGGLSRVATADQDGEWTITLPVVFLSDGSNLLDYVGPLAGDHIEGIQESNAGNTEEIWFPYYFYPYALSEIQIFPGGNSVQDLYYFPI